MTIIEQSLVLPVPPDQVFAVLTQAQGFSALTGGKPAELCAEAGTTFSLFGGMIEGRNVEVVQDRRLVQAWRAKPWPEGSYSLVRFDFAASDGGTELTLRHEGFPEGQDEHLRQGWQANYLAPLRERFGGKG